jgi:hypothetical protein
MSYRFCGCLLVWHTWCCMYNLRLMMMDGETSETCRVLFQNKINLRYCASGWFYYRYVPMPVVIRCYIISFILHNITTIWKLRLKNNEQEKVKSFIQFCWLWWQGTMCVHDYHFQTTKEQICIAQLNQSEPRSAACRAEYYTQLSDPNCMTCWHQWRWSASFIMMPCFSRVMNRKTLG